MCESHAKKGMQMGECFMQKEYVNNLYQRERNTPVWPCARRQTAKVIRDGVWEVGGVPKRGGGGGEGWEGFLMVGQQPLVIWLLQRDIIGF